MIIYLEATINLLFSAREKETVEKLIQTGVVKQIESEKLGLIKYLKIEE